MRMLLPALFSVLLGALALAAPIVAATDFACLEDCMRQGYGRVIVPAPASGMQGRRPCPNRRRAIPPSTSWKPGRRARFPSSPPRVDPQCLSDCRARGWKYQLCRQQCSY